MAREISLLTTRPGSRAATEPMSPRQLYVPFTFLNYGSGKVTGSMQKSAGHAQSSTSAAEPLFAHEFSTRGPAEGKSVRVIGKVTTYVARANRALLEHKGGKVGIDTTLTGTAAGAVGSFAQVFGEYVGPESTKKQGVVPLVRASIFVSSPSLDAELLEQTFAARRAFFSNRG